MRRPGSCYQVWGFIAPGLYSNEKRFVVPFVLFSTVGFLAGAAFNHYVAYPFIMTYFASFNTPNLVVHAAVELTCSACT